MDFIINFVKNHWEIALLILGTGGFADVILGYLPDKYSRYVGIIRRIVTKCISIYNKKTGE